MKNIITWACVTISLICCNSGNRQQDEIQNKDLAAENSQAVKILLPDSLFYRINMSFFDVPSIPYNESIGSRALKVATGTFRQKVIDFINELEGVTRTNVFYLSKQAENKDGLLITIYTENEIDPGSIYLLSLDRQLNLTDYRKIGYERCDLEDQTDTCEVSFCDIIVAYEGRRTEVETDSTKISIKDKKFFYSKLK